MDAETSINKIKLKISEISQLASKARFSPEFKKWHRETVALLTRIFGEESYQLNDFANIDFVYRGSYIMGDAQPFEEKYRDSLRDAAAILTSLHEEIAEYGLKSPEASTSNPISQIELLLARFHSVARQMRQRHADRPTLDVQDEYDLQDLLHSLLRIPFKDGLFGKFRGICRLERAG